MDCVGDEIQANCEENDKTDPSEAETHPNEGIDNENPADEEPKWWDSESQNIVDSQQLAEGLSLCADLLQSQSPNRDDNGRFEMHKDRPSLSVYAHLGPEQLKKDIEECQNHPPDPAHTDLDTPQDVRLSQLVC